MAQTTRFNGTWDITGIDALSNVQINSHSLIVNGNLRVLGSVSNIAATNTQITDNIITLNQGETGSGVTAVYSGIEINRGALPNSAIRWNESNTRWELTTDGSTYIQIATGSQGITAVIEDTIPALGGNLNVLSRSVFSANTAYVKFDTNVAIKNTTVAPATQSGYNVLYTQTPSSGGSGVYVTNTTTQQQELVTKTKAIVFALIM
jgi:hypothetical protein